MNLGPRDHVTSALNQLHWLPVHRRIQFKLCSMMHSIHVQQSPVYLTNLVQGSAAHQRRPGLRSGDSTEYRLPRCRSTLGMRAFSYAGPLAWNTLPPALRDITDRKQFRKSLKTHLYV